MLYSPGQIQDVLNLARTTTWKLAEKSERLRVMDGESVLEDEIAIIRDLKKALEYGQTRWYDRPDFHEFAAYTKYKCSSYGFDAKRPYFGAVTTPPSLGGGTGSQTSGWVLWKQMVVGVTPGAPAPLSTEWTDADLAKRNVVVILDSLQLAIGLNDRQSYVFNSLNGKITWREQLQQDQVIQIYTYVTGAGAWDLFRQMTVGQPGALAIGSTSFTDENLIGRNVIVDVDGAILPRDIATAFSFSTQPLTGTITWNSPLQAGQVVKIYLF